MGKSLNVERKELKYLINEFNKQYLLSALKATLNEDNHNGEAGYSVRSLYLDSIDNKDYFSKMNGEENRKKIRLRVYGANDKNVKLEIKRKFNINQRKDTLIITREVAERIIYGDFSALLDYDDPLANEIYTIMTSGNYRPVVMIEYERIAFYHDFSDIRVTLDFNIRKSETNFDLFSDDIVMEPIFLYPYTVLEVKHGTYIHKWLTEIISECEAVQKSVSKYCLSRSIFEGYFI